MIALGLIARRSGRFSFDWLIAAIASRPVGSRERMGGVRPAPGRWMVVLVTAIIVALPLL